MKGLDFRTQTVGEMENYLTQEHNFNYDLDYLEMPLSEGLDNLAHFISGIVLHLEMKENYNIIINLENKEPLDYEDYMDIFTVFTTELSRNGIPNNMGYLGFGHGERVKTLRDSLVCSNFSLLQILNHSFEYGTIQLTIVESNGDLVKWVS